MKEKVIQILNYDGEDLLYLTNKGRVIRTWSLYRNTKKYLVDMTPNFDDVGKEPEKD